MHERQQRGEGAGGRAPWIRSTDKAVGSLMVLFLGLIFPINSPFEKFFADTLGSMF